MQRDVAIAGVYATRQARSLPDVTSFDICLEAVTGALADAGLSPDAVDGAALDWPGPGGIPGDTASWAPLFGRPLRYVSQGLHDAAGPIGVARAAAMISAGLCDVVVVGGGTAGPSTFAGGIVAPSGDPYAVWGAYIVPLMALMADRHRYEYGTTDEQIAEVAAIIRNNGHSNPEAVMFGRGPYTVESVLASPLVSSPLRRLEICLVAQGGGALVLTTLERARDLRRDPIRVLGSGLEYPMGSYQEPPTLRRFGTSGRDAAGRAFAAAGLGPTDVDVWCLYDMSAFEVIRQVEALGLCEPGEGGPFVADGRITTSGTHPVNPDGGCLAHSWNVSQQLTLRVIEAVRQLRGTAVHQIDGARRAIACGPGGANGHMGVVVLGSDG